MTDYFDRLENRTPAARENALLRDLRHVLSISKPRVPALRAQLRGVDIAKLTSRADLVAIPVLRRADLVAAQAEMPPFGGMNATRLGGLKQTFFGPGSLVSLGGQARDWWGMGRAFYAAGLRKGTLVLNCFPYDLVPHGHMADAGAETIGCPVIPAGESAIDRKLDVIAHMKPGFFCGRSDEFKAILDRGLDRKIDMSSIKAAVVTGPSSKGLRNEYSLRGFDVRHVFLMPELGAVAFETGATEGMTVNEGLIVEVIDPLTKAPVVDGGAGELVITRINTDFPLLRFATGAITSIYPHTSSCGRTNTRIRTPHERNPDFVESCGRRIQVADIFEIARCHPGVGKISLVMRRSFEQDVLHLRVEHHDSHLVVPERIVETLHHVTHLRGTVELLAPGSLSDDDATIVDERPIN